MGNANIPQVFNQQMERLAMLDKATAIGYKQVKNGIWTARFTLPADDPKNQYCRKFNYVEIFDDRRRVELFRIIKSTFTRGAQGFITYDLEHVITTLLDNVLFKFHSIGNIGVFTPQVINYVLSFQTVKNWQLGVCAFNHQFLYKWESSNLLFALFDIPKPFIDEWHFTYDTTVYPWTLNLVRAETVIGCELRRRKNMQGITKDEDAKNLVTRLYPLGYGEGDNQLTIKSVNNGAEFMDADTIPLYGIKESVWTDRRFEDAANMMATGRQMLERLKMPYTSYTVESIDLFKRTGQEFDEFKEGKLVRVIDRLDGIDLDTRIMEIDKPDVTKADITVVIANMDRNVAGSIAALQERTRINDTYAQGAETLIPMTFIDNAEPNFPAVFEFFIPGSMVNINEARLRIQLLPFRAFSRAVRGGGGITTSTLDGGGITETSTGGGGTTSTQQERTETTWNGGLTTESTEDGGGINVTSEASSETTTHSGGGGTSRNTLLDAQTIVNDDWWNPATHNHGIMPGFSLVRGTVVGGQLTNVQLSGNFVASGAHSHGEHSHMLDAHAHNMPHNHRVNAQAHRHTITIGAHAHQFTIPGHSHTVELPPHQHRVTIPEHRHTVTLADHTHNITLPPHQHGITIPDHTHEIEFGIFTGTRADSVSIRVDNNTVPITGDLNDINIIPFLRRDGGGRIARNTWHRLELIPNRLTRLSASIFLNIFTNSRGGARL